MTLVDNNEKMPGNTLKMNRRDVKKQNKKKTIFHRPTEWYNPGVSSSLWLNSDSAEQPSAVYTSSNVKSALLGNRRERQTQRKWGRLLTAQSSFSMKMEDKCLASLTVPPGRGIVIISWGTNKESESNDKSLCCPLITRIIVTYVEILNTEDFGTKMTNHGEVVQF